MRHLSIPLRVLADRVFTADASSDCRDAEHAASWPNIECNKCGPRLAHTAAGMKRKNRHVPLRPPFVIPDTEIGVVAAAGNCSRHAVGSTACRPASRPAIACLLAEGPTRVDSPAGRRQSARRAWHQRSHRTVLRRRAGGGVGRRLPPGGPRVGEIGHVLGRDNLRSWKGPCWAACRSTSTCPSIPGRRRHRRRQRDPRKRHRPSGAWRPATPRGSATAAC